ncbi:uncharacterized protein [Montipora foliosa]
MILLLKSICRSQENRTQITSMSSIQVTPSVTVKTTMMINESRASVTLPFSCYRMCVCNQSATTTMEMSQVNSVSTTSVSATSPSHTTSSISLPSVSMSDNFSTISMSVTAPTNCSMPHCWEKVICNSHASVITPSLPTAVPRPSVVAPTEPFTPTQPVCAWPRKLDCNGVCNGTNSTCIGCDGVLNSGKVNDACGVCEGNGASCASIVKSIPRTIANCNATVWVVGAGLDAGVKIVCGLYDPVNGGLSVFNTTAKSRNVTHALCDFEWDNYTAGEYNLSVTIVYHNQTVMKINESLSVYYYSCSNFTVTNVSPSKVLIDALPRYVTLAGSGFFDWAGRETVCFIGHHRITDVMYVDANNLKCKIPTVPASTQFSLSVSMDGGRRREGFVNLTVFAPAPSVTAAKFTDTAAEIVIYFEKEVEFTGMASCSLFFDIANVTMLGQSPRCSLKTTQKLEILLGTGATILVGQKLTFMDNVFKARGQLFSRYLNGSFSVGPPDIPLKPIPRITGPTTLSKCGNLTLSGLLSSGGGGRRLNFLWSLKPNSTAAFNITNSDRVLIIPGDLLTAGASYEFQLGVSNFLNPTYFENVTHSVVKSPDPVPFLSLSSSVNLETGEVFVSEDLIIKVTAEVAPCVNNSKVDFLWTVSCPDENARQKVEDSFSFMITKTKASLRIAKGVLTSDVICTFNVTGSMSYNRNVKSSAFVSIKAISTPLVAAIVGGNRQIGLGSGIVKLDAATQTLDPDSQSSVILRCNWGCRDQNDDFCFSSANASVLIFASAIHCKFDVQSSEFTAGKTYNISVEVSKGSRNASTFILLTVVEGNPPEVWMAEAKKKVLAHDRVTLEGFYSTTSQPDTLEWTCVQEIGFAFVSIRNLNITNEYLPSGLSYTSLILPKGFLQKGSKYRFQLTVNDGSKDGVATMDVEVRSGPTSGSLTVDKSNVKALFETVTLEAIQWTAERDSLPLRYAFGALSTGSDCELWGPPDNSPVFTDIMPAGSGANYTLALCVIVWDAFDSFATAEINITSNPLEQGDLDPSAVEDLWSKHVEVQLNSGNLDQALSAVNNIADTVRGSSFTSADLKRNMSEEVQDFIVDYLASAVVGEDNAPLLLTTLTKTAAQVARNRSNMAGAAATILDGLGEKSLSDGRARDFFTWMGDLVGPSIDTNDDALLNNMVDAIDKLGENLGAELLLGDPPREVVDDRLGTVNVRVSKLNAKVPISTNPGAPRFDPERALKAKFGTPRLCGRGKTCTGAILKAVQFARNLLKEEPNNENDASEIYESQVVGLDFFDPVSKTEISLHDLSTPLKLTFNIGDVPEDKEVVCSYFNETKKAWVTDGMNAVEPVNGSLTCESTHATYFAPSSRDINNGTSNNTSTEPPSSTTVGVAVNVEEEKDYTGAIIGGVIGGLLFITIVVAVIWCFSKKNKAKTRVTAVELPQ